MARIIKVRRVDDLGARETSEIAINLDHVFMVEEQNGRIIVYLDTPQRELQVDVASTLEDFVDQANRSEPGSDVMATWRKLGVGE